MQQHATLRPPPGTDHELVAAVLRDQPDDDQIGRLADVFALLPAIFGNGFESDSTSAWSQTVP